MNDLKDAFDRLLADEPPASLALAPVVRAGRRGRVARRAAYGAAGVAACLAAVAVAVPVLSPGPSRVEPQASSPAPVRQAVPASLTGERRAIAQAIVDTSPAGWTFDLGEDRWTRGGVDATADDGKGAARLLVVAWQDVKPARPCADPLYVDGGVCTESRVDGGVLSILEGTDQVGLPFVRATLAHDDGSGVIVEATSYTLTWPLPRAKTEAEKRALFNPSRSRPAYTPAQVGSLAVAVADAATSDAPSGSVKS